MKKKANIILMHQKTEIEIQKKEITDSIHYAKRIQTAILPQTDTIEAVIPDHFILFKPKDIVSGDFYWLRHKNNKLIVAAADCTGHGVPGAFMSMLGIAWLSEIVNSMEDPDPAEILNRLRDSVIKSLHQTGKFGESQDGMDISLCVIDQVNKGSESFEMQYAGAHNSMYHVAKGLSDDMELTEVRADRMPIGIHRKVDNPFITKTLNYNPGELIYLFTDGYPDQFGGSKREKFKYKQFRNLLFENHDKSMSQQKEILEAKFEEWRGDQEQVDDVLVIGVRLQ